MSKLMSSILPFGLLVAASLWWNSARHDNSIRQKMVAVNVSSEQTLFVSAYEVTIRSWKECYASGHCSFMPIVGTSADNMPITGINWFDVNEYLAWANQRSTVHLRLPSLAEWRVLNRSLEHPKQAPLFTDPRMAWAATYGQEKSPGGPILPSGSFTKTLDGIYDLDGNVWEWTSTCFKSGFDEGYCPAYNAAGEHEAVTSIFVRNPAQGGCATGTPPSHIGMRLVADE